MGIESLHPRETFGLEELGLLDNTPFRPIDTTVRLCVEATGADIAAFIVFDDVSASKFLRSCAGPASIQQGYLQSRPEAPSASNMVREEMTTLAVEEFEKWPSLRCASERTEFGAAAYLGAPVFGPVGEVLGVVCAMQKEPRRWTAQDRRLMCDHAYILAEQVMLRAALATVKLMARETSMVQILRQGVN